MQKKMAPNICLNAVMQTQQYADKTIAVQEGARLLADGADCVMPMGVTNEVLKAMADNNIAVFGHVGCLSGWQTNNVGGYRRTGVTAEDAMKVFRKAYEYQENGMIGMTIEMTSRELTNAVAKHLRIPVVAVAAGGAADGSEMVIFDLFGFIRHRPCPSTPRPTPTSSEAAFRVLPNSMRKSKTEFIRLSIMAGAWMKENSTSS